MFGITGLTHNLLLGTLVGTIDVIDSNRTGRVVHHRARKELDPPILLGRPHEAQYKAEVDSRFGGNGELQHDMTDTQYPYNIVHVEV